MSLPANKGIAFKTMDIKTALLNCGSRKRKASSSQDNLNDMKSRKLSNENETVEEDCGITLKLDQHALNSLGDCKENKDVNALNVPCDVNKTACESMIVDSLEDKNSELISDAKTKSDNSSCDELNSSTHNVSLNTSTLSVTADEGDEKIDASSQNDEISVNEISKDVNDQDKKIRKKRMTAAEAKRRAEEREQKQKERLLKKEELERKKKERILEKERKRKERIMRKEREEYEKKEREKERLQKLKEKEEEKKFKLEQKLEEKKKKEEMKLRREEEIKKAEEEKLKLKLEKEQKEREKKERAKAAFVKFFVKGDTPSVPLPPQVPEKEGAFLPFQVSDDMILAPAVPPAAQERFDKEQLDKYIKNQESKELYLQILKSGSYKDARHRKRIRKLKASDADIIVIDKKAEAELDLTPKLLQFCENLRPPYWGTWRKKSKNIRPRNPFGQDNMFDYEVDSDDEWDEGGPGESLSGTEQEDESEDDYEVDNEFFVPHGYLSDEEEKKEEDEVEEDDDPEKQKERLKMKLQEFEMERKKKTTELKPIILGCYFENEPDMQDSKLGIFLQSYCAELLSETPIPTFLTAKNQVPDASSEAVSEINNSSKEKKKLVPEEALPQLIRLVHGSTKKRSFLAKEFQKFWFEQFKEVSNVDIDEVPAVETDASKTGEISDSNQISLRQLAITIKNIAAYGKSPEPSFKQNCWWVHDEIREKYGLTDAPVPNQWNYVSEQQIEKTPPTVKSTSIKGFLVV